MQHRALDMTLPGVCDGLEVARQLSLNSWPGVTVPVHPRQGLLAQFLSPQSLWAYHVSELHVHFISPNNLCFQSLLFASLYF
jgi:hypothetical protein